MQHFIVAIVVLFAAGAVVRQFAPHAWKEAFASLAAQGARRLGWDSWADRLTARPSEAPACVSGCSSCSGCDLVAKTPAGEFVVVVERMKKAK